MDNNYIEKNKEYFISLLNNISRENANIEGLVAKLSRSDFFTAPASTKYHMSERGGLCEHSLNVYDNLVMLNEKFELGYTQDNLLIVGLLHDISKMNYYEETIINKKVYSENGKKFDELGKYDWVSEKGYKTRDTKDRFLYGNHEETSEYMVRSYIPLTPEESVAILNHMGGMGFDSSQTDLSSLYNRYSLAAILHAADMLATYIQEKI